MTWLLTRRAHRALFLTAAMLGAMAHGSGAQADGTTCSGGHALGPFTEWAADGFDLDPAARTDDGRLVVRLNDARAETLRLRHDAANDEISIDAGARAPLTVGATGFADLLLRCVRFDGFRADDHVTFDGVDAGLVARHWRIPYLSIGPARARSAPQTAAIAHIDALTDHGALGVALTDAPNAAAPNAAALATVRRNTVAMLVNATAFANTRSGAKVRGDSRHVMDVGGGILLRINDRLVVVTASHIVPRAAPRRGVLALAHDGTPIPLLQLLHGGRRYDLAIYGFADPAQEAQALETYGGVRLAAKPIDARAFVFHVGFPDTWQSEARTGPVKIGMMDLPWLPRPTPVLTSGLVDDVADLEVRVSARLAQGDSGGGFFTVAPNGEPRLLGPVSTVRSRTDGNPPDAEVAGPVIGGVFRLHVFDLPRLMPNYFAANPAR